MKILALDIGMRRTGVAFADDADGVALALTTIAHRSSRDLVSAVQTIVEERGIDGIVFGLPLLPSGEEGKQSGVVRSVGKQMTRFGIPLHYLDERYTTQDYPGYDGDASAAVSVLQMALQRKLFAR